MSNLFLLLKKASHAAAAILHLAPATPPAQAAEWSVCVAQASARHGVNWPTIVAIITVESRWNPSVVSRTNDYGLGQLHCPSPRCARVPTPKQRAALFDGCTNIEWTTDFLRRRGVRAYNPGNPRHAGMVESLARKIDRMFSDGNSVLAAAKP